MINKLFFFMLIWFCWLVFGQEKISNEIALNPSKENSKIISNEIPICCEICDPLSGVCKLFGSADYSFEIDDNLSIAGKEITFVLKLQINSELIDVTTKHSKWIIKNRSVETVNILNEENKLITKHYSVTNRWDIALVVVYQVTVKEVRIVDMMIVSET